MKKVLFLFIVCLLASACSHVSENIIGYNERGETIVQVCKSRGTLNNADAFGSSCKMEIRDYGRVSNKTNTVNVVSNDNR